MIQKNNSKNTLQDIKNVKLSNAANPIVSDSALSSYFSSNKFDQAEIFDRQYAMSLELMCGDKLLKPASSINSVQIRKTTTPGLYKLVLNSPEFKIKIRHIDEGQLLNNREYCKGTVSLSDNGKYELMYYDDDDEIVIEHYSKEEVINFMNNNKLIFQL